MNSSTPEMGGAEDGEEAAATEALTSEKLTHVVVRDTATGAEDTIACGAAFVAIGHIPNTGLFTGALRMDANGYLETEGKSTRTSVPGVFAAGDVADHVYVMSQNYKCYSNDQSIVRRFCKGFPGLSQ